MTASYKEQATAFELSSVLAVATGLAGTWALISGVPTVTLGSVAVRGGGATIQIYDQYNGEDRGWDALPGFSGVVQPLYTTGTARLILEADGVASVAAVKASATATLNAVVATNTIVVGGTTFTGVASGATAVQFNIGGSDTITAANIAAAINANTTTNKIVYASSLGAVVTVQALVAGVQGNLITLTGTAVRFTISSATLVGGAGGAVSTVMPVATLWKLLGELGKRGLRVELYLTDGGNAPVSGGTLVASFEASVYWPLSGQV